MITGVTTNPQRIQTLQSFVTEPWAVPLSGTYVHYEEDHYVKPITISINTFK